MSNTRNRHRFMRNTPTRLGFGGPSAPFDMPAYGGPEVGTAQGEFRPYLEQGNPSTDSLNDFEGILHIGGAGAPLVRPRNCTIEQSPFALQSRFGWADWSSLLINSGLNLPARPPIDTAVAAGGSLNLSLAAPTDKRIEIAAIKLTLTAPTLTTTTSQLLEVGVAFRNVYGETFNLSPTGDATDNLKIRSLTSPLDVALWICFPNYVQTKAYPVLASIATDYNPGGQFAVAQNWTLDVTIGSTLPDGTSGSLTGITPQHPDYLTFRREVNSYL